MPYAIRNERGDITSLHRQDPGVGEWLGVEHPQVRAFVGLEPLGEAASPAESVTGFERLDAEFVRVLEDVIDALTTRNVINITDLPETAQAKLFARRSFRDLAGQHSLQLFESADFGKVI